MDRPVGRVGSGPKIWTRVQLWSAVESTTLAQPFCVNQAEGDLPHRRHAQFVVIKL